VDTKAYIASGIIESYVLGLSSAEETVELEQLCTQYEDIRNAVDEFAAMMETQAFNNAVPPPPMVKDKVMHAIADEQEQKVMPIGLAIDAGCYWPGWFLHRYGQCTTTFYTLNTSTLVVGCFAFCYGKWQAIYRSVAGADLNCVTRSKDTC